jgi:hypothetical protein
MDIQDPDPYLRNDRLSRLICCDDADYEARRKRMIDEEVKLCRMALWGNEERTRVPKGIIEEIPKGKSRKQNPVIISPRSDNFSCVSRMEVGAL